MNVLLILAAVAAGLAFVIARQLRGEPLRGRRVILLPVVLIAAGVVNLVGMRHLGAADIACIAVGSVIAAAIGVGQGALMRLECREGGLWGQLPTRGLWLWGALILSRLTLTLIAVPLGAHAVSSVDSILLVLGVNRLAQAAVIALRAIDAGIPFAAEKDGKAFLPALFGQAAPTGARTTEPGMRPSAGRPVASPTAAPSRPRTTAAPNWSATARLLADRLATRS